MARILLVDDSDNARLSTQRLLELDGHHVFSYGEPAWALHRWAELQPIDVVISDINMPYMNGPELISRLRAVDGHAVYLGTTGYATPAQHEEMKQAGARMIIPKPSDVRGISRLVRYCTDNKDAVRGGHADLDALFGPYLAPDPRARYGRHQ